MTFLPTCKDFLRELGDFLDDALDPVMRRELEQHVNDCPNCWVVLDTTKKTIQVYKGQEPKSIPADVHNRLMEALRKKMAAKRCGPDA
jgi:anti-sigma factor RsiW